MRTFRTLFVLVLFAIPAFAQTDAEKLLNGRRVDDSLVFEVNDDLVTARVDGKTTVTVIDGATFTSPGEVNLAFRNFNPFTMKIEREETTAQDPTAKAVADFVDAFTKMAKIVFPVPAIPAAEGVAGIVVSRNCEEETATCRSNAARLATAEGIREERAACASRYDLCRCEVLSAEVTAAREALGGLKIRILRNADLQAWAAEATGKAGVESVRRKVEQERQTVLESVETANEAVAVLTKAAIDAEELVCDQPINVPSQARLQKFTKDAQDFVDASTKLAESLKALADSLRVVENGRWANNDMDYIFATIPSNPNLIKTEKVTFTSRTPKIAADKVSLAFDDEKDVRTFNIRRYRRLVPEVGVAVVYNELEYPKYTAVEDAEKKFRVTKETDDSNVEGALMLNFLCNCIGDETIFPGIQFGISTADDYPGVLLGLSIRFGGLEQLSFGAGGMVTWYKELKSLKVGDEATQEAIDADLHRRRSDVELYFAVQYVF